MAAREATGTIIGRYKLLKLIGEGGFGSVFLAEQEQPVKRRVALKVIKLGMDTREVVARFEVERQALAMMDHPNIARVFDAGSTDSGRPYFVMELVDGIPITHYCDTNKLATRQRLELMVPVCRAVQSAHQKGIIHRDLKPSNVLVTLVDGKPVPKVIDFGIAKATGPRLAGNSLHTAFQHFVGTPAYMSPEQVEMGSLDIDTRADVYGIGVLLYELLTGTTPVEAAEFINAAIEEFARLIRESEPAKPSIRLNTLGDRMPAVAAARGSDERTLSHTLRGELDWIVMKALEKDRARRYDTAAALGDDLTRYLAGEAVAAGPPGRIYQLRRFARRHKTAIGVAIAIGLALLLGAVGTTVGLVRETRERRIADAQRAEADRQRAAAVAGRAEAESQRKIADAVVDFLTTDVLEKASPSNLRDNSVREVLVKTLIEPSAAKIGDRFRDQPLVRAAIQQTLALMLKATGRYDLALQQAKAALATRRAALGDDNQDTIASQREVAFNLIQMHGSNEADPILKKVWDQQRRLLSDDDVRSIEAVSDYGFCVAMENNPSKALPLFAQALERGQRALGDNSPYTLKYLANYAHELGAVHRYAEAEPLSKLAWERSRKVLGDDAPATMIRIGNYALLLNLEGRFTQARPLAQEAYEKRLRLLGPDHPSTITAMDKYIDALRGVGDFTLEAHVVLQDSAVSGKENVPSSDALAHQLLIKGNEFLNQHQFSDGYKCFQAAVDLCHRDLPDNPDRGVDLYKKGICAMNIDRISEAESIFRENWEWDHSRLGNTALAVPLSFQRLNDCLQMQGKPLEALPANFHIRHPSTNPATTRTTISITK